VDDTEQLFAAAAVWTVVAAVIARFIPNWPGRIAFFVLAVGLPFWELPYGYYNFQKLCSEQIGPVFFEKIASQESICISDLDSGAYLGLVQAGFSRIEVTGRTNDLGRDSLGGRVVRTQKQSVNSKYCVSYVANIPLPWRVLRNDVLIRHASDDKVAGRQSGFQWAGMWWQEQIRPVLGRGGLCFGDPLSSFRAIRGTSN